jgi:trypsin
MLFRVLALLATFLRFSDAIVGGVAVNSGESTSTVSLQTTSHFCGAILVSQTQVLTHPSCVQDRIASRLKVRVGSRRHASGGLLMSVSSFEIHSGYTSSGPGRELNGIALLTLSGSVPANVATPAMLPLLGVVSPAPASGTTLDIAGWGATSQGSSSLPASLVHTSIDAITNQRCSEAYPDLTLNEQTFCASRRVGGASACTKDAGGPVVNVADGTLVGIIGARADNTCAQSGHPDVYTNLNNFSFWLIERLLL